MLMRTHFQEAEVVFIDGLGALSGPLWIKTESFLRSCDVVLYSLSLEDSFGT
jgi:hypothetical protein